MSAADSDAPPATSQTVPVNSDTPASTTSDGPPTTYPTVPTNSKPVTVDTTSQESPYAWDTAGIYGPFSKPIVVDESEFRLVDQRYDVGQVIGAPNGSNLSIVYEQIINNLVPGFNNSQANSAKERERIRKWLLKEVPAALRVKEVLDEQHNRNGSSSTDDSDGSFAVSKSGQCCHDPGLTRSDPDPSSSDSTMIEGNDGGVVVV